MSKFGFSTTKFLLKNIRNNMKINTLFFKVVSTLFWIYFILYLTSCSRIYKQEVLEDDFKSEMNASNQIFFTNTRQIFYDVSSVGEDAMTTFKKKNRLIDAKKPILNLAIVRDNKNRQAFIYFDLNDFFEDKMYFEILWESTEISKTTPNQSKQQPKSGKYIFNGEKKENHFRLATQIRNAMMDKKQLFILKNKEKISVLTTEQEKDVFRITMVDFYRLVGLL